MNPLWYKDAVIYETHVKAFFDGNGDGIGDFPGLLEKLDYLQDLGITCLWLLPFFPSPLRDDGYDISDYTDVHPNYGTLDDFKNLLKAARDRELRVIIELVINHTSDQHRWFQESRNAPAGSAARNLYVWSDTDKKYSDARIIFTDTEKSNWTWDAVAGAYYWHRFFSHQPDLNFDNPAVIERILEAMRFWLDIGVDGLRLDAIPYLIERDGTNCENLPETHAIIKRIRRELDSRYSDRMLLAEANQWPTDVRPYFGTGDECHMAFHFPLMPRIFMALRMEDRQPITDIMAQTPDIPGTCQWALFLRNHDELTLEMVTEDERDYMYLAYSADPRMKLNVGIRRRLAPLMENNRGRIELLICLLFSFPGTPIIYYGDEIGMGDNIYLGDRNGVRTPMQWSSDRNAGFSRANPARLYSPVIMDPVYGYEAANVEAQLSDSSSLLYWVRNMVALRKVFRVFGRGSIEFLSPQNRKVLAYLRRYGDDQVLCVANLSRFAQAVELDLSGFAGMKIVEMFGYTEFPAIGSGSYTLSLNPYGFFWFELQGSPQMPVVRAGVGQEDPVLLSAGSWTELFESGTGETLEREILPGFLATRPWFVGRALKVVTIRISDWAELPGTAHPSALVLLRIRYSGGSTETYYMVVSIAQTGRQGPPISAPENALCQLRWDGIDTLLYECTADAARLLMLEDVGSNAEIHTRRGVVRITPTRLFNEISEDAMNKPPVQRISMERDDTCVLFGNRIVLKLYHNLESGVSPEFESLRHLGQDTDFDRVAPLAGAIEYVPFGGEPHMMGILQVAIENQGTGWQFALEELGRFYEHCAMGLDRERLGPAAAAPAAEDFGKSAIFREAIGLSLEPAAMLGRRTAELHRALSKGRGNPAFTPETLSVNDQAALIGGLQKVAAETFEAVKRNMPQSNTEAASAAEQLLEEEDRLMRRLERIEPVSLAGLKIRIHGNYHLGQVLRVNNDFTIVDLEADPSHPFSERRAKASPLKDVADMLGSFRDAAYTGLFSYTNHRPDQLGRLWICARLWYLEISSTFLQNYYEGAKEAGFLPQDSVDRNRLLTICMMDKALTQFQYELKNCPSRMRIPLQTIVELMESDNW